MPNKGSTWQHFARLFSLFHSLAECGSNGATLEEIRAKVYPEENTESKAFHKKFLRDREALRELYEKLYDSKDESEPQDADNSGLEIYKKSNRYYMQSDYVLMSPMKIGDEELQVLVTGIKLAEHFVKPLQTSTKSLWGKLKKQFRTSVMAKGERLGQAISFAVTVSDMDGGHGAFQKVVRAIDEKKVLKVGQYEDHEGKKAAYTISPYALYFKYHAWYLMGSSSEKSVAQPTVFRLNRMLMVEVQENGNFIECPYPPEKLRENIELDFHPANPDKEYNVRLRITGSFARAVLETVWFNGEKKTQ